MLIGFPRVWWYSRCQNCFGWSTTNSNFKVLSNAQCKTQWFEALNIVKFCCLPGTWC